MRHYFPALTIEVKSPGSSPVNNKINISGHPLQKIDEAEKAINVGNLEDASVMLYQAIEAAMVQLAKSKGLPHADHDDLFRLARSLDDERGTNGSHWVRFEAARGMYDNARLHFLDLEETLMAPQRAREFVAALEEFHAAA